MEDSSRENIVDVFLLKYRYHLLILLIGIIFITAGILFFKKGGTFSSSKVEILNESGSQNNGGEITVELSGEVVNPGVYKLIDGSRVDDLLVIGGGFSVNADRAYTDKYLNRAAKLTDGQKIYIPAINKQLNTTSAKNSEGYQNISSENTSDSNDLININTASTKELDSLPGIGPVYAQKIIEHRPYSKPEDLVSGGVITQTIYEKIKNSVTVY